LGRYLKEKDVKLTKGKNESEPTVCGAWGGREHLTAISSMKWGTLLNLAEADLEKKGENDNLERSYRKKKRKGVRREKGGKYGEVNVAGSRAISLAGSEGMNISKKDLNQGPKKRAGGREEGASARSLEVLLPARGQPSMFQKHRKKDRRGPKDRSIVRSGNSKIGGTRTGKRRISPRAKTSEKA